jgi:hypothetical protein
MKCIVGTHIRNPGKKNQFWIFVEVKNVESFVDGNYGVNLYVVNGFVEVSYRNAI